MSQNEVTPGPVKILPRGGQNSSGAGQNTGTGSSQGGLRRVSARPAKGRPKAGQCPKPLYKTAKMVKPDLDTLVYLSQNRVPAKPVNFLPFIQNRSGAGPGGLGSREGEAGIRQERPGLARRDPWVGGEGGVCMTPVYTRGNAYRARACTAPCPATVPYTHWSCPAPPSPHRRLGAEQSLLVLG